MLRYNQLYEESQISESLVSKSYAIEVDIETSSHKVWV